MRLGWEPDAFERVLWHGGLQLDGRPLLLDSGPPAVVSAGVRVVAWRFVREPEPIPFGPERVLRDAVGIVAVDKPPWLPMQGTRASQRISLERAVQALLGRPGLRAVHRLDRQTSGVAVFADGAACAARLGGSFQRGDAVKTYHALVAPPPAAREFTVSGPLGRVAHPSRIRFALLPGRARGARPSETRFVVEEVAQGRCLLRCHPLTGRSHQIRVHLAAHGSPVCGDDLYGPPWSPGAASSADRTLLHATRLRVAPAAGAPGLEVEVPPPPELR